MDKIPITFEHNGIKFDAYFSPVKGSGGTSVWHLMSFNHYYLGQLVLIEGRWAFHGAKKGHKLEELSDYFGEYLTAYLE